MERPHPPAPLCGLAEGKRAGAERFRRWCAVVAFAVAMAWMEAATVIYLRRLVGRVEPYQPDPLPPDPLLGGTELVREGATMVMLAAAGWLAGDSPRRRFGWWALAFGTWDLFYYVFLATIGPWPRTPGDWDVLFLIPLPWWGPVAAPAAIAALMVTGGTAVGMFDTAERPVWPGRRSWSVGAAGAGLALYVFMADAIRALGSGPEAVRAVLPTQFNWPLFLGALALMAVPALEAVRKALPPRTRRIKGDP